ncbi:hypothetical protein TNCV_1506051 [Trichonephila clavipes]|nr:hypothetical protein TNCV_1506051 [Trichonephila clavipes]
MDDGMRPKNSSLAVDGEDVSFRFGGKKSPPVLNGLDIQVERGIMYIYRITRTPSFTKKPEMYERNTLMF